METGTEVIEALLTFLLLMMPVMLVLLLFVATHWVSGALKRGSGETGILSHDLESEPAGEKTQRPAITRDQQDPRAA